MRRKVLRFFVHFAEMCVVMCVGAAILGLVLFGVGVLESPAAAVIAAPYLVALMTGWMRLRKHEWRPTLEMAATPVVALPLVLIAARYDVLSGIDLFLSECTWSCGLMLIPMLARFNHYAEPHAAHTQHRERAS